MNHSLSSFKEEKRKEALLQAVSEYGGQRWPEDNGQVNLHLHSFFSYNAEDWSPARIAWEARMKGLHAVGIVDFDVLDGLDEFIWAGDQLGLRTSVGLETRTFLDEMRSDEIDSPGEPGVSYIMGAGFTDKPMAGSAEQSFLLGLFQQSRKRNLELIARINGRLPEIAIDYEKDVLPLTPSGNATERHIVKAYISASEQKMGQEEKIRYWSEILEMPKDAVVRLFDQPVALGDKVRSRLAKRGGIGYVQPSKETFPETGEVFRWFQACGAIPTESWLDGTSPGESDPEKLLELSWAKGARALNIIPDRNWNIDDLEKRKIKVNNLRSVIRVADSMGMPIQIGTEMNKAGQLFYDDLTGPVLKEFREVILRGTHIIMGHNLLSRFAGVHYLSDALEQSGEVSLSDKNETFERIGLLPPPNRMQAMHLLAKEHSKAFDVIMDSARKRRWSV